MDEHMIEVSIKTPCDRCDDEGLVEDEEWAPMYVREMWPQPKDPEVVARAWERTEGDGLRRCWKCDGDKWYWKELELTPDQLTAFQVITERPDMLALMTAALDEAVPMMEDLGQCPYLLQNGDEGQYGPNTCNSGCNQEPECQTCGPFPSTVVRAVLVDLKKMIAPAAVDPPSVSAEL